MARSTWYKDKNETKIIINGEEWVPSSLLTSYNSDYSVQPKAPPKLPSLESINKHIDNCVDPCDVAIVQNAIKELGNFA